MAAFVADKCTVAADIAGTQQIAVQVMLDSALLYSSMMRISMLVSGSHHYLNSTLLRCSMSSGSSGDSYPSSLSCMASYSMLKSPVQSTVLAQIDTLDWQVALELQAVFVQSSSLAHSVMSQIDFASHQQVLGTYIVAEDLSSLAGTCKD